ncbi:thioredoxin family protein [Carboxylicivirga sediminis]|uniref:Thioredoxin family protein n=1 Tax=Carboxylicivirga sediminis TaxID=2006564 RepID=A0A941F5U1_9BACT|nr:thioredoxin family protein [Carboxylicivirga sediminis]MBR8536912.1 thioredoxin family protein [Carboxylicivirga sediminis]
MRFILSVIFSMALLNGFAQSSEGIQFTHGKWEEVKQLAKEHNKPIFIDCYTSWCGPCKMLSKNVFTQAVVGQLFNNNFINYKIDMEKGDGPALKSQYNVAAYPTLIWVDAEGNELHKVVGAPNTDELLQLANVVLEGKGLAALKRNYQASPENYELMLKYIEALKMAFDRQTIQQVLNGYFTKHQKSELLNESNYVLIKNYLDDIYSPAFIWFDKHQKDFKERYPAEEIEQKLFMSYLSHGRTMISKNGVDQEGYTHLCKTLKKRRVKDRDKIVAFLEEDIYRTEKKWDDFIRKVQNNITQGYHVANNALLYYNWALVISQDEAARSEHFMQAAEWMEKAFEVSQWPLVNNIVYLEEKLKILVKADNTGDEIKQLEERISALKKKVNNETH